MIRDEEGKHNVTPYPVQLIRWQSRGSNYGHELHLAIQFFIEYETGVDLSHLKPQQALEVRVPLLGVQLEWVEQGRSKVIVDNGGGEINKHRYDLYTRHG